MFPSEAITLYGTRSVSSSTINTTLFDVTPGTKYTVLYMKMYSDLNVSNVNIFLYCDTSTNPLLRQTSRSMSSSMPIEKSNEIWGKFECTDDMILRSTGGTITSDVNWTFTYLPDESNYAIPSQDTGNLVFVGGFIIFLLSMIFLGLIFNTFVSRKKS